MVFLSKGLEKRDCKAPGLSLALRTRVMSPSCTGDFLTLGLYPRVGECIAVGIGFPEEGVFRTVLQSVHGLEKDRRSRSGLLGRSTSGGSLWNGASALVGVQLSQLKHAC